MACRIPQGGHNKRLKSDVFRRRLKTRSDGVTGRSPRVNTPLRAIRCR